MRSEGEFRGLGEGVSHVSMTSIADPLQAVWWVSGLCSYRPPDPRCTAALPPSVLFFPTRMRDIPPTLSCGRAHRSVSSPGLADADPFSFPFSAPQVALPFQPDSSQQPACPSHPCRLRFKFWGHFSGLRAVLWGGDVSGVRWPPLEAANPRARQRCVVLTERVSWVPLMKALPWILAHIATS